MDIVAHGLWTAVGARAINLNRKRRINPFLAAWWGVFPDLFAFTVPFVWLLVSGYRFHSPDAEPPPTDSHQALRLASSLYNLSHSAVVFVAVVVILFLLTRRVRLEMYGWLLHILIDIPTHSYRFFPTPFLWPISEFKFNGFSWADPRFMVVNYGLLVVVYVVLWVRRRRTRQ